MSRQFIKNAALVMIGMNVVVLVMGLIMKDGLIIALNGGALFMNVLTVGIGENRK